MPLCIAHRICKSFPLSWKGSLRVNISHSIIPKLKMSHFSEYSVPEEWFHWYELNYILQYRDIYIYMLYFPIWFRYLRKLLVPSMLRNLCYSSLPYVGHMQFQNHIFLALDLRWLTISLETSNPYWSKEEIIKC